MLKTNTKTIVLVGVLSAMAVALMYTLQFPILPGAPYLKIDFSDVPALFASIAISPVVGAVIMLIKNILHLPVSDSMMFGELSNFLIGSAFIISAGVLSKQFQKNKPMKKKLILILILASLIQVVAAVVVNLFIMLPLYPALAFMRNNVPLIQKYIIGAIIPFNLIKDALASIVFYFLYRYVYPAIQKQLY